MDKLKAIWNSVSGKKTYFISFIVAGLNLAVAFDWISPDNLTQINMVLVALGIGALRSGVTAENKK